MTNYLFTMAEQNYVPGGRPVALEPFTDAELADTFERAEAAFADDSDTPPVVEPVKFASRRYQDLIHAAGVSKRKHAGLAASSSDQEDTDLQAALQRSLLEFEHGESDSGSMGLSAFRIAEHWDGAAAADEYSEDSDSP